MTANNQRVSFPLGQVLSTPGALSVLGDMEILVALSRHARGDWGEVCEGDRGRNELAARGGTRISLDGDGRSR